MKKNIFEKYNKIFELTIKSILLFSMFLLLLHLIAFIDISTLISLRSYITIMGYLSFSLFLIKYQEWDYGFKKKANRIFSYILVLISILLFIRTLGIVFYIRDITNISLANYDFYLLHVFLLTTSFFFISDKEHKKEIIKEQKALRNKWVFILLIGIIGLGIFLRVRGIFLKSPWFDEGISMLVAQRIAEGHGPTLLSGFVYTRAPLYHQYLSLFYKAFGELYGYGVIANIPFFITTSLVIYFFTKDLSNKVMALFATFLFSFSWYPIAEFRNIRFYEVFLSLFMLSVYFFYKVLKKYFDSKISDTFLLSKQNLKEVILFLKENYLPIILSIVFFFFGFRSQILTAFLIPSLAIVSFLIFVFTKKKGFLFLFIFFGSGWIIANIVRYRGDFELKTIFYQPEIVWLETLGRRGFWETFNFFIKKDYWYFLPILILSLPIALFSKKRLGIVYLTGIIIGYYTFVALQGSGTTAVRYYYPILPLMLILTSVNMSVLLNTLDKKTNKFASYLIILLLTSGILLTTVSSGIVESRSIYTKTSRIGTNNRNYREFFEDIKSNNIDTESYIIVGDSHTNLMYYIHNNEVPSFNISRTIPKSNHIDIYLEIPTIGYLDFEDLLDGDDHRKILFMYDNEWERYSGIGSIVKGFEEIYLENNKMLLIRY